MRFEGLGASPSYTAGAVTYGTTAAGQIAAGGGSIRQNLISAAPSLTGTGFSLAAALGSSFAKAAIPIVGPAIAGATVALALWQARKGPYQKTATTEIVNEAEPILQDNMRGYLEGPRTAEAQAWALKNFDDIWAQVVALCGKAEMGEPGRRCISERQRGGSAPWCPTSTGCDWFVLYRDPIAAAAPVSAGVDPSTPGDQAISDVLDPIVRNLSAGGPNSMLLIGGAALLAVAFFWGDK
jgi:hypothetical protein